MQGQANHFSRYAPEKIEYGINRYQNETRRLYGVLDEHLKKSTSGYLVGDRCTIADIAHWGWVTAACEYYNFITSYIHSVLKASGVVLGGIVELTIF
jgi:glutathione S-transferase